MKTLVKGINKEGKVVYYTGKSGKAWISENRAEAFDGFHEQGAATKAKQANLATALTGITFTIETK